MKRFLTCVHTAFFTCICSVLLSMSNLCGYAQIQSETSVAGLFPLENSGRQIWNFNAGWRFHRGDVPHAETTSFNDQHWEVVSTPHTAQLVPAEASGGRNYQGVVWYRKHFVVPASTKHKLVQIYFEAVMGKQEFYINGKHVKTHFGGYLPIILHLDQLGIAAGDTCVLAVKADNSNDKTYPPGKPQYTLDFCYHGGIYRDVWLIAKAPIALTDAMESARVAGGGVFVHFKDISQKQAQVGVRTEVANYTQQLAKVKVTNILKDEHGKVVDKCSENVIVEANEGTTQCDLLMNVKQPMLWSPEQPHLYQLETRVFVNGKCVDGGITKVGIRSFAFKGKDGFYINGQRYRQFVGANRHQDFAYVGNAVPNSQQWRDAKRLKDAGFNIIRTAHYPQDPAFMDACDELGLFVIVATPGWQYWNSDTAFVERVMQNTREIIRRDRNHASVLMWEPILNETRFPEDFAIKSLQLTRDEYPFPYRPVAAADMHSAGVQKNYDVVYGWPGDDEKADKPEQCIFTREFGEYVDDWYAHNNLNRASRSWGEHPQLVQALSLANTTAEMYRTTGQFIGGCQWHPFDHQRGYHPDPYWGGIYDAFRQPKYAFYMFHSQTSPQRGDSAFVYIAHEMSQFSPTDVTVFSNCDSVRLSLYDGTRVTTQPVHMLGNGNYHAPVVFKNVWDFWEARNWSYTQKNWQKVNMVAEGIINGKVVTSMRRMPSRRSTKLRLYADEMGKKLVADGSDFMVVVAEVTDDNGHERRLAKEDIVFTVEGEGELIGNETIGANPRSVEWGSAPCIVRSTQRPGKIVVKAHVLHEGTHAPTPTQLIIESVPSKFEQCFMVSEKQKNLQTKSLKNNIHTENLTEEQKQKLLKEVEQQQADFGISTK